MESVQPAMRAVEFGIYRDGDNNLDMSQALTLGQALQMSAKDSRVEYTVEDTTALRAAHGDIVDGALRTDAFTIADGSIGQAHVDAAHDMASPKNLAQFVAHVLDNAEKSGAKQTWIELTDHGAGDGGGLEADSAHGIMSMPSIANAIAEGVKLHAQEHPEDANRGVDGVVANQCLMASMGFADALSRAGVKFLAASPETMVSPGVPSTVAHAIAAHESDAKAMAKAVVSTVMGTRYGNDIQSYGPAAAFDVLDLDTARVDKAENSIKQFNDDLASAANAPGVRSALREDTRANDGMVRFPEATHDMPWHADRPAIALYNTIAQDGRLNNILRADAKAAADAVSSLVLAHKESSAFEPFGGASYSDAVGPTIHAPVNAAQVDPWGPTVSETNNNFFKSVDQAKFVRAVA